MAGLIKNVPVLTFGIVGNRGHNFPLLGHLVENFISPFQTNADCELIKEQNNMQLTSEKEVTLLVNCADIVNEVKQPNFGCTLATQEDVEFLIFQQEGSEILVSCDNE